MMTLLAVRTLYQSLIATNSNDTTNPVGAVSNRTGLECVISSNIHYNSNDPIILKEHTL